MEIAKTAILVISCFWSKLDLDLERLVSSVYYKDLCHCHYDYDEGSQYV